MNESPLHPALQTQALTHRRRLRGLSLLLFVTLSGMMMVFMVSAFASGDIANVLLLAVIGLVMLPVMALLGGLLWYLDRRQLRRLSAANHLLRECPSVMARLTPTGRTGRNGILMILEPLLDPPTRPLYALIQPALRTSRLLLQQEITVQWHCRDRQPGSHLVAVYDRDALLGRMVEWKG